jgi:protoporphyrinogen oxidase
MPIRELIQKLSPEAPGEVLQSANALKYRDFLTVALVIDHRDLFRDNWIYIHDPDVRVGRIQNFKNWSPEMVPDPRKTCLGLEYFCFEGDGLWTMSDEELIELGKTELEALGLARASEVEGGSVVRMLKAYPVYDSTYRESLDTVRRFLAGMTNLQLVGRNGMHKYNNQDHAMLTAMLAARNIMGGDYDLWKVNVDQEYHEEVAESDDGPLGELDRLASTQPRVPARIPRPVPNEEDS